MNERRKSPGPRGGKKTPIVFRLHNPKLRRALERYRAAFEKQSGYALTFEQIATRALAEHLRSVTTGDVGGSR